MSLIKRWGLWVACLWVVVGCSSIPGLGGAGQTIRLNPTNPEDVARSFLDAWNAQDTTVMYTYLATPSQSMYPFDNFNNRYAEVNNTINFEGVSYTLQDPIYQGDSASITYDVTLRSSSFGEIIDSNRTMYFVREVGVWKLAWSSMDILKGMAESVRLTVSSQQLPRANIYDRNGLPLVEENGTIRWLAIIRNEVFDEEGCIRLLANVLLRSEASVRLQFNNNNLESFFHVGELDNDSYFANEQALNEVCGINNTVSGFQKTGEYTGRHYYGQGALTHSLGYVGRIPREQLPTYEALGYTGTEYVGLSGVEASGETILAGKPELILRLVDENGITVRELGGVIGSPPTPIQLTLDRNLQLATARAVNDAFNYAQINWASVSTGAAAVVIDVRTGNILAITSYPTFDPSIFNPDSSYVQFADAGALIENAGRRGAFINRAVREQYTPGSIYKLINAMAALDTGVWTPNEIFDCTLEWRGQERYGDSLQRRQDWRVADGMDAAGPVTVQQAIATSCNPFFWEMGAQMYQQDSNRLVRYSDMFGIGRRVGLNDIVAGDQLNDLGLESGGNTAPPNNSTSAINNAIGQGDIQLNPLQYTMSIAAIANRGTLWQPHILRQIGGFDDTQVQQLVTPNVVNQITLSDTVWDNVRGGMCMATVDQTFGTGRWAFANADIPPSYTVCGKTGTAETGARDSGSPPHGWFVAFAPAENPEVAVLVVVLNGREGSETAAPIARRILDNYFGVPWASFPEWWIEPYVPVNPPEGVG
jgi:penicillin-binding protein 2